MIIMTSPSTVLMRTHDHRLRRSFNTFLNCPLFIVCLTLFLSGCGSGRTHLIEVALVNPINFAGYSHEIAIGAVFESHGSPCASTESGHYTQHHFIYLKTDPDTPTSQVLRLSEKDLLITTHRMNEVSAMKYLSGHVEIKDGIMTMSFVYSGILITGERRPNDYEYNGTYRLSFPKKEY